MIGSNGHDFIGALFMILYRASGVISLKARRLQEGTGSGSVTKADPCCDERRLCILMIFPLKNSAKSLAS